VFPHGQALGGHTKSHPDYSALSAKKKNGECGKSGVLTKEKTKKF
jgi:hypothetical protein